MKLSDFKISVIVPMYNSEKTIKRVLESINDQSFKNCIVEIIVVNDGSNDESEKVVEEYIASKDDNIIKIINTENGGVSKARNLGMKSSIGNWIALVDSDDIWHQNKLELQINEIMKHNEIDFIGTQWQNKPSTILGKKINTLYKLNLKKLCIKMLPQTSTVLFKKEIFNEIGGYDENQKYAEDGNFFLKIADNDYQMYYLPIKTIDYGDGKRGFGDSGLSANLKEMYKGNLKNINELKNKHSITILFYVILRLFYILKYLRRIIITKIVYNKR